jgi:Calcineurin-like phosphoesterase superfamily domain
MSNRIPQDHDEQARQAREKLTAHRGMATWGEQVVPLGRFRQAAREAGRSLAPAAREQALAEYLLPASDATPVEGPYERIAVMGGVYNNHYGLAAFLEDATKRGAEQLYCLGDLGGFGPSPERVRPLLAQGGVRVLRGNYEDSLASGREDCNCGYTDPRDNHYAEVSYRYTERNCSREFKQAMGEFPGRRRVRVGTRELLLVHGSPRRTNEFLFASTTPNAFLETLLDRERAAGVLCTHTGLPWHRWLPSGRDLVNVGALGRPANDGRTQVCYALLEARDGGLHVELVPLSYDHHTLAAEMRREGLPEEFVETILTGWWTTCLEILPPKERAASKY